VDGQFLWALLQLATFLPLVIAGAYLVTRYVGAWGHIRARSGSYLEVVERLMIGPRCGLYVVRMGTRYCLLGVSEKGLDLLRELSDYPAPLQSGRPGTRLTPPRFLNRLRLGSRAEEDKVEN